MITEIKPEYTEVVADLRRFADAIENGTFADGKLIPTSIVLCMQDRVNQKICYKIAGERMVASANMGLLCYVQQRMYTEI